MKIQLMTILIFMVSNGHSFTINPDMNGFSNNNISIEIANSDCSGAGFSTSKYESLVTQAVNEYWNKVATSAIYLKVTGINSSIDIDGDQFSTALDKVKNNTILAGCNDDVTSFSDGSILGAAVGTCDSSGCRSVLILNSHADSYLKNKSDNEIKAVIAHEIGHAFGLGHSEYQHNLMYYSASGKNQKWLGIDDIDGVTYLYPHDAELAGLLGSCGTIKTITNNNHNNHTQLYFLLLMIIGMFLVIIIDKIILKRKIYFM